MTCDRPLVVKQLLSCFCIIYCLVLKGEYLPKPGIIRSHIGPLLTSYHDSGRVLHGTAGTTLSVAVRELSVSVTRQAHKYIDERGSLKKPFDC